MRQIIGENQPFVRQEVSADEAKQRFVDQPYKIELIEGLEKGGLDEYGNPLDEPPIISFYSHGPFTDLCRGPHVESTGKINPGAVKLLSIAGAYWRGDEKNKMLQRIYGTAWESKGDLDEYLKRLEEAKKRDHRKLGKELDLFTVVRRDGPGLPLWHPKRRHDAAFDRGLLEARRIRTMVTIWSSLLTSVALTFGKPRGTSVSTTRTCIRRWT